MKIEVSKSDLKLIVAALDSFGWTQGEYGRELEERIEDDAVSEPLDPTTPADYLAEEAHCEELIKALEAQGA